MTPAVAQALEDFLETCASINVGISIQPAGEGWKVGWSAGRHGGWLTEGPDLASALYVANTDVRGVVEEFRTAG